MLTLPGLTIPSDRALRAAVRRIIGMPGAIVMIGPVVNRSAALVALLDHPRDLYLCHDFGPDGESYLTPMRAGTRWRRGSPMALGDALRATGYPMSRIYWSREPVEPSQPVALVVSGRRLTMPLPARSHASAPFLPTAVSLDRT